MAYELTVRDAMQFPSLSKAQVVSGEKGLTNEIRTVIVGDTLDIADWVEEKDFVLSSVPFMRKGSTPPPSEELLYNWMLSIMKRKPSAIGIKTMNSAENITDPRQKNSQTIRKNYYLDVIPDSVIQLGNQFGVPIIALPAFSSQNDISRDVMWGIIRKYEEAYKHSTDAFLDMCNIILDEHDLQTLAKRLAQHMGNPILIEDEHFNLITTSVLREENPPDYLEIFAARRAPDVVCKLRCELMESPGNLLRSKLTVNGKTIPQEIMPILVGSHIIGYVTVFEIEHPITPEKRDLFITGASAIAIDMHQKTYAEGAVFKEHNRFLNVLLDQKFNEKLCANMAGIVGFDESKEKVSLAIGISRKDMGPNYSFFNYYVNLLMQQIFEYFSKSRIGNFICEHNGCIIAFVNCEKFSDEAIISLVTRMQEYLEKNLPTSSKVSFGIGRRSIGIRGCRTSCIESIEALQYINDFKPDFSIAEYSKISHHMLLSSILKDREEAKNFCRSLLGKLLERDRQENSDLLKTLETFLACNGSYVDTGKAMYLHPKTIKYRIEQISKLLPLDLSDMGNRSTVWMALKLLPHIEKELSENTLF